MYTQITVYCPRCKGHNIKKNGFDDNQKQRYACKDCTRRFIGDHHLTYKDCHSQSDELIWKMTVSVIFVPLRVTVKTKFRLHCNAASMKLNQHKSTMMFCKWMNFILLSVIKNKVWLIYAYHQKTGQMVAFVWGKREQHTKAIEGNNCVIRHRISRAVRKSCFFPNIGFAYINACHWRNVRKNRI